MATSTGEASQRLDQSLEHVPECTEDRCTEGKGVREEGQECRIVWSGHGARDQSGKLSKIHFNHQSC